MRIAVLVKQVPDTWQDRQLDPATGLLVRDPEVAILDEITERALEVALAHKDLHKDTEVVVVSMGPATTAQALRRALSMGADSGIHILDDELAGSDLSQTAAALAGALAGLGADLIVAGNESTDGRAGLIPAMVAEHLELPLLSSLKSVDVGVETVTGESLSEDGTVSVHAALPAVVSVTEQVAEARFPSFKGIISAKRKPISVLSLKELGGGSSDNRTAARSVISAVREAPARAAGTKIIDAGNAGQELVEFLAAGRFI